MSSPFEWLYDGLPEDGIQEHASLRLDLASTPEQAAAKITDLVEESEGQSLGDGYTPGAHFVVTGKRWLRANITIYGDDENEPIFYGSEAERLADEHDAGDTLFYAECEPDEEGAAEWWHCELCFEEAETLS